LAAGLLTLLTEAEAERILMAVRGILAGAVAGVGMEAQEAQGYSVKVMLAGKVAHLLDTAQAGAAELAL
jgi:RsiW-degrading membrane proteinase PrsW (M82 family)